MDPVFAIDAAGTIVTWNWGAEDLYGIRADRAIGQDFVRLSVPEDQQAEMRRSLQEALDTGSAVLETTRRKADGSEITVQAIIRRLPHRLNETTLLAVNERDLSEAKRLEAQLFSQVWSLQEAEAFLNSVLDSASEYAVVATNHDDLIESWNRGAKRIFGHPLEDAIGTPIVELLFGPDEAQATRFRADLDALHRGEATSGEYTPRRVDGSTFPARFSLSLRRNSTEEPVGYVLVGRDISVEKQKAAELDRKTNFVQLMQKVAVAANEATRLEDALQVTLDAVCVHTGWPVGHAYLPSPDGTELVPSRTWHFHGDQPFETFRTVTEATRFAPGIGLPGRVWQSGRPAWIVDVTKDSNFPRAKIAADIGVRAGFGFPALVGTDVVAVFEFFAPEAIEPDEILLQVVGNIGVQLGRIVERQRAAAEHRRSFERAAEVDRLKDVSEFKGQFLRTVSHELGTPITPLKLQVHMLKEGKLGDLNEDQQKSIGILDRNLDRLASLVQDILEVARIQSGRLELAKAPLDLDAVVAETVELFEGPARGAGVELRCERSPNLNIEADRRRITQVLVNFLSNALKFTPQGGRITVRERTAAAGVTIEVQDTGAGLAPAQMERLFQPFSQVHDASRVAVTGTGLGLFISRGIVEQHGGQIGCRSDGPGRGATFFFTIPNAPAAGPDSKA